MNDEGVKRYESPGSRVSRQSPFPADAPPRQRDNGVILINYVILFVLCYYCYCNDERVTKQQKQIEALRKELNEAINDSFSWSRSRR